MVSGRHLHGRHGTGEAAGELGEDQRRLGQRLAGLGGVTAVVEPDREDLPGVGLGRAERHIGERAVGLLAGEAGGDLVQHGVPGDRRSGTGAEPALAHPLEVEHPVTLDEHGPPVHVAQSESHGSNS